MGMNAHTVIIRSRIPTIMFHCAISYYSCRATEWPFYFGFIAPFILLHVFDWIMFVIILASIIKHNKNSVQSKDVRKSHRDNVIIALSLAVVFGLGWGFGLLTTSSSIRALTATFQTIFSVFVGTQGVLLFLLHGLRDSDVRELWKEWLTYFVLCVNKSFTKTSESTGMSQTSGMSTLPRTLPRKVDTLKEMDTTEEETTISESISVSQTSGTSTLPRTLPRKEDTSNATEEEIVKPTNGVLVMWAHKE